MQNSTQTLTTRINDFDRFYSMSDSNAVWSKWNTEKDMIMQELKKLDYDQVVSIYSGLNENGLATSLGKDIAEVVRIHKPTREVVKKPQSKLSKIMTNAWVYFRKGIYLTFSECLKAAWKAYRIISKLKEGIVYLTYRKADGATREAIATLRQGNFSYRSKGSERKSNPSVITYWDLENKAYRAFRIDRLINLA